MGRPSLASIEVATTDRLLHAAEHEFAEHGLQAARLEDIAGAAGITRASLLYHYRTKEALHAAVVEQALASLAAILTSAVQAPGTFSDRVDALVEGFYIFIEVHPALARILVREIVSGNARVVEQAKPVLDGVVAFVESEHPRRDLAAVARPSVMLVVSDAFLRVASQRMELPLWGDRGSLRQIARRVICGEE
jgi:TetR/AcrR family transcriptional regulator